MVNVTDIENKLWTSVCPSPVYGEDTGSSTVPYWEGVTTGTLSAHQAGWTVCGVFALINTLFAFTMILQHLRHYNKPSFQRYYVRIILMIPVYSIVSFLGYRYDSYSTYFELALDFYEAFVIASFFILILNMLGEKEGREKDVLSRGKRHTAMIPMCCLHFHTDSWWFLETVKWCVLQYVLIEPLLSVVSVVLQATGKYCEESYSFKFGHVYAAIIEFIIISLATYILIQFYIVIRHDIKAYNPLWKFVAIKLVIFLSFYQSMVLSILGYAGVIKASKSWTQANIEYGLNSLIITVEMFLFCFLDLYAYSWKEFKSAKGQPKRPVTILTAAVDALNIFDLFVEVGRNLKWFWLAVVLRREHVRRPDDARFDIHASAEHRAELMRQETAAIYGEDVPENLELKQGDVYARARAEDDSDDEQASLTRHSRALGSSHSPNPFDDHLTIPTPYGHKSRGGPAGRSPDMSGDMASEYEYRGPSDHRVSEYLRDTRSGYSR